MANQYNASIPALANTIAADIPDIQETLGFFKDCFEAICEGWNATATTNLKVDVVKAISWTEISSFSNSWVNAGGTLDTAGYCKDVQGFVHLKGVIKNGTLGSTAFNLPAGYRPAADKYFSTISVESSVGYPTICAINTSGDVAPSNVGNDQVVLDGITFYAG